VLNFQALVRFFFGKVGRVLLIILISSMIVPFLVSQVKPVFQAERIVVLFLSPACLLTALALKQFRQAWFVGLVIVGLLGWATYQSWNVLTIPESPSPKMSVQHVVEQAQCGDTMITGGLSLSEVTYYLNRMDAPKCIERVSFPAVVESHPGWLDIPDMLSRTDELELEAENLCQKIASRSQGDQVWFFYDGTTSGHKEVQDILKLHLDQDLRFVEEIKQGGSFFDRILVYVLR
jgi:hypothetical protein